MTAGADELLAQQSRDLRAAVLALRSPETAKRAPAPRSSVYGRAAAAVPRDVGERSTRGRLEGRFRTVETSALLPGTSLVLLVVADAGPLAPALRTSLQALVRGGSTVVALGRDVPRDVADPTRPVTVPLRSDDDLAQEWGLVVCGPARRTAFLARTSGDGQWDWLLTQDSVAVHRAASALLERVPFLRLRVPELTAGR